MKTQTVLNSLKVHYEDADRSKRLKSSLKVPEPKLPYKDSNGEGWK